MKAKRTNKQPDAIYVIRVLHGTAARFGEPHKAELVAAYHAKCTQCADTHIDGPEYALHRAASHAYHANRSACEAGKRGSHYALSLSPDSQTELPPVYIDTDDRLTFDRKKAKRQALTADAWTYDVWGNARDGFDVNDRYRQLSDEPTYALCVAYRVGACGRWNPTENRTDYYPAHLPYDSSFDIPDSEIRRLKRLAGISGSIDNGIGDDRTIYFAKPNGYPTGEIDIERMRTA